MAPVKCRTFSPWRLITCPRTGAAKAAGAGFAQDAERCCEYAINSRRLQIEAASPTMGEAAADFCAGGDVKKTEEASALQRAERRIRASLE